MVRCYIGLGSNLDHPQQHVSEALSQLQQLPESEFVRASRLYRSVPMGPQEQPDYINAVAVLDTELKPHDLLDQLQVLEQLHQRVRSQHWGPRTLDLDLLLYANQMLNDERLIVPHAGLGERNFVLYPLQEVAEENMMIPGLGRLQEIIQRVSTGGLELVER